MIPKSDSATAETVRESSRRLLPAKVLLAFLLAGATSCAGAPPTGPFTGADPADAAASTRPVNDTGVLGAYTSARPVAPRSWREQNERVAPQRQP